MAQEQDVGAPQLPRQQKIPRRYKDGNAPAEFHCIAKERFRQIYFEGLDLLIETISRRFDHWIQGVPVFRELASECSKRH